MYRDLLATELVNGDLQVTEMEALGYLSQAYTTMCKFIDTLMVRSSPAGTSQQFACSLLITGTVGRPAFEIPRDQLQYLIENRFSVSQIAQLLGVSVSTVRRRMTSYNFSIRSTIHQLPMLSWIPLLLLFSSSFPTGAIDKCMAT